MHKKKTVFVGIDVSKSTFNAHWQGVDAEYANNRRGWSKLLLDAPENSTFGMESTGNHHYRLAAFVHSKGYPVKVFNPYLARLWARSLGGIAANDKIDARNLSKYAATDQVAELSWEPLSPELARARAIVSVLSGLARLTSRSKQMKKAVAIIATGKNKDIPDVLGYVAAVCEEQVEALEKELCDIIADVYPAQFELIQSIPGIAAKTAAVLLVFTRGFEKFETHRQLVKYIGLAPTVHDSGVSVNVKGHISKTGNPYIRSLLFLCAFSAARHNTICEDLYSRLIARNKKPKVAFTAVMHRLLKIAFGVVRSGVPFHGGSLGVKVAKTGHA